MKILSWNVNGLRAVYKRDFLKWLEKSKADIVCLQEIKSEESQLSSALINPSGYKSFFNPSSLKKGHSGVAVFTKIQPEAVEVKIGLDKFDGEGRILKLDFADFTLFNLYMPQGGRDKVNLGYKLSAYDYFLSYLEKIQDKKVILMGDFNIAHQEIDLSRPKQNQNNIMFTSEERQQIDKLVGLNFSDSFRVFNRKNGNYTWWPYAYSARQRNIGWRIDYGFVSGSLEDKLKNAFILPEVLGSDHCPTGIEIEI